MKQILPNEACKHSPSAGAKDKTAVGVGLRQRAEAQFAKNTAQLPNDKAPLSPSAMQQHLHELGIHQIELEMQNEELRRLQVELEVSWASYIDLYDFAPIGYCIVSERGLILQANLNIASLLGISRNKLIKQPISRFIFREDQDAYYLLCRQLPTSDAVKSCELRMIKMDGTSFWAHLTAIATQDAAGAPLLRIALSDISERKQATESLRSLSAQLTQSEERERCLLAHELHDNLGQLLAAIKIKLNTLELGPVVGTLPPAIDSVVKLVDQADQSVRLITQRWSPPVLRVLGFEPALQWLSEDIRRLYGVTIHVDIQPGARTLVDATQAMLFRSVRELLINVAKHAQGSAAYLSIGCDGSHMILSVRDTGCGFDPAQIMAAAPEQLSFGLRSIHERMLTLGGSMIIDSSPGNGTAITLTLPCAIAATTKECLQP